jgi:hypothetical protein
MKTNLIAVQDMEQLYKEQSMFRGTGENNGRPI